MPLSETIGLPSGAVDNSWLIYGTIAISLLALLASKSNTIVKGFADALASMRRASIDKDEVDIAVRDRQIEAMHKRIIGAEKDNAKWHERAVAHSVWDRSIEAELTRRGIEFVTPPNLFYDDDTEEKK